MFISKLAPAAALLCICLGAATAATPDQPLDSDDGAVVLADVYTIGGGDVRVGFNTTFLQVYGIDVELPQPPAFVAEQRDQGMALFSTPRTDGLQFSAKQGRLDRFVGGLIRVDGRFALNLPGGDRLEYEGFQLRVDRSNPMRLDLVGADGQVWLYVNHLMYELVDDLQRFQLRAADLRATPALAQRVSIPELSDAYVGNLHMLVDVLNPGTGQMGAISGGSPNFHGAPFSGGGIYEADVLMQSYSMSFSRCRLSTGTGDCDGNGPDNGEVVFTPSSTLRNSNNPNTADVPWYEKFTGHTNPWGYPYPNADQHPYLIWNLYRIVDDQLEQIAASALKHAWLTTNGGCGSPFGNHVLSPNCTDTYGTGNNDASDDLGPRSELIPATGYWGRCGSIFDVNCDGVSNSVNNQGGYRDRLIVRESQLSTPGAVYYSDSWYVVQDDINIYNTMMHRTMTPTPGSSGWIPGTQGASILGAVIDTWVDPATHPTRNVEIDDPEGHTKIAVKVKTLDACPAGSGLSGTCYRYDYAVHNFDFARAVLGDPPNHVSPNLRVISNNGFNSFTVPVLEAATHLPAGHFADIDIDAGNNWSASFGPGGLTWTAPAGNELNWGHLYRFSFVSNIAPDVDETAEVVLGVAGPGTPSQLSAAIMVPAGSDLDLIFANGFETGDSSGGEESAP